MNINDMTLAIEYLESVNRAMAYNIAEKDRVIAHSWRKREALEAENVELRRQIRNWVKLWENGR